MITNLLNIKFTAMDIKKLDKSFDICLWGIFLLSLVGTFFLCKSLKAPTFEIVDTPIKISYVYSSEDGERYDSYYVPVWKHERFAKPKVAVYDPKNGKNAEIKPEFVEEYRSHMPESQYPFYTRWTIVIFGLIAIALAFFVYWVGGYFRDLILYTCLRSNPAFTGCAYFLYEERVAFKNKVKKLIGKNIGTYIGTKSQELYKRYNAEFAKLLIHILESVRIKEDTDVEYFLTYQNLTTDQKTYLVKLRSYWDRLIGKDENAENNVKVISSLLEKDYIPIKLLLDENDIATAVNNQLNKLFTNILGGEVLKFYGCRSHYQKIRKISGSLHIDINVRNHHSSFSWSGNAVPSGNKIPGLEIEFKIYHYVNGEERTILDRYLVPVCTYSAKDEEFAASELYKSMVLETISTFHQKETK